MTQNEGRRVAPFGEKGCLEDHGIHVISQDIPFSQRCLRRLPSFPLRSASRLFRLSRRMGSRRLNETEATGCVSDSRVTSLTFGTAPVCTTGTGSSRGIDRGTEEPRRGESRVEMNSTFLSLADTDSDRVKFRRDAAACSDQAEIARVCCGVKRPCELAGDGSVGWMAMLEDASGLSISSDGWSLLRVARHRSGTECIECFESAQ
jgi:hypothetical protein